MTCEENINYGSRTERAADTIRGDNHGMAKSKEYYETNAVLRTHFKKVCKNRNWNFDDFEEIFAEEWYVRPNGYRQRKFYYKEKK